MYSERKTVVGVTREFGMKLHPLVSRAKEDLEELMGEGPTAEVMACLKVARILEAEARGLRSLAYPIVDKFNGKDCR